MKKIRIGSIFIIAVFFYVSTVYANSYLPLHGDMGEGIRGYVVKETNFVKNFRVFLPPGCYFLDVKIYVNNDASNMHSYARLGAPPSRDQYEIASHGGSTFSKLRAKTMASYNADGLINIADVYSIDENWEYDPFNEDEADWLYVSIEGGSQSLVYYIWFQIKSNKDVYNAWYSKIDWMSNVDMDGYWKDGAYINLGSGGGYLPLSQELSLLNNDPPLVFLKQREDFSTP